jgi:hypothetical protein
MRSTIEKDNKVFAEVLAEITASGALEEWVNAQGNHTDQSIAASTSNSAVLSEVKNTIQVDFEPSRAPKWFLSIITKLARTGFFNRVPDGMFWSYQPEGSRKIRFSRTGSGLYEANMESNNGYGNKVSTGKDPRKPNSIRVWFRLNPDPQSSL